MLVVEKQNEIIINSLTVRHSLWQQWNAAVTWLK